MYAKQKTDYLFCAIHSLPNKYDKNAMDENEIANHRILLSLSRIELIKPDEKVYTDILHMIQ